MASLTIEIPADAEQRLREEAARRNDSAEALAARLLIDQLRLAQLPAEFDMNDQEIAVIRTAVDEVRAGHLGD